MLVFLANIPSLMITACGVLVVLFLAVSFTLIEKKLCERRIQRAYDALIRQAAEVVPVLSTARVLLDMYALSARRTASLENLYSEIVGRLVSLVGTEIVPGLAGGFARELTGEVERHLAPVLEEIRDWAGELERASRRVAADGHSRPEEIR
jgi:hypothetical protein